MPPDGVIQRWAHCEFGQMLGGTLKQLLKLPLPHLGKICAAATWFGAVNPNPAA
jgi:hypothetical protein